ncbi:MAG: hypothetical protein V4492_02030 [Chlamydiota bacterium]
MKSAVQHSSSLSFPRYALETERPTHLIKPTYSPRGISTIEFDAYVTFIEQILRYTLPEELVIALSAKRDDATIKKNVLLLGEHLPLLRWNDPERAPCTLCISVLCPSDYTGGVGRYLCDTFSRWLIPGKFLNISSVRSLNFTFISYPENNLYFHQLLLDIDNDRDLAVIKDNWIHLEREIRLSILSVRHARKIVSAKQLSSDQKKAMIEENLASVIDIPLNHLSDNVFNHMHHLLMQLSSEDKIKQIQEQISPYLAQKPKSFDREIFQEIKHFILLFEGEFTASRDLRHVSRLISFLFLFRKTLTRLLLSAPEKRHLSLKLLKTKIGSSQAKSKTVLAIVGAMNVLRENELFEERHIIDVISHCLPPIDAIPNSIILDRRSHDPIRLFYLEIEKQDKTAFTLQEIQDLKKELPRELKESVESIVHPVLMPRNEEEIMRNTLLLSQQLKFVSDLPQVIISFNAQTEESLLFTVILLRIVRSNTRSLTEIFSSIPSEIEVQEIETRKVGLLRKRLPKEANVFKVSLNKKKYIRKDFTIDLFKARQAVSKELGRILKGIRDFNGGILSKQQEVFHELRALVNETSSNKDFLLENFFYSISPPLRQSLIPAASLKALFTLMQEALEADFKNEPYFLKAQFENDQLFLMAASPYPRIKEELSTLLTKLQIPTAELSYTYVNAYGISCLGYLYQNRDPNIRNLFFSTLLSFLQEWKSRLQK